MKWEPDNQDPGKVVRSVPERFVIVCRSGASYNWWLTDLASNHPPNPPRGFETQNDARDFAEQLGDRT